LGAGNNEEAGEVSQRHADILYGRCLWVDQGGASLIDNCRVATTGYNVARPVVRDTKAMKVRSNVETKVESSLIGGASMETLTRAIVREIPASGIPTTKSRDGRYETSCVTRGHTPPWRPAAHENTSA
jgi:hypothetical protein